MTSIPVYLINLDGSDKRLHQARTQLEQHGIAFERVSAVDGRKFVVTELLIYNRARAWRYMGKELVGGEFGCYMSHMLCAEKLLASDAPYAIVLEDDVRCDYNFLPTVAQAVQWLEHNGRADWQVFNIGNQKVKLATALHPITGDAKNAVLQAAHYFPITTTGLVWSRAGARAFLQQTEKNRIFAPVDNFLRYWQTRANKGYCFAPPLVSSTDLNSDIVDAMNGRDHDYRWNYYFSKHFRLWQDKLIAITHKISE